MSDVLQEFDMAVLEEAWDFLQRDNIDFAIKLEKAVKAGATPDQLTKTFLRTAGEHRGARAKRIENAAKYLYAQKA